MIVSVIMAAYNAEAYVSEAIESILSQTFSDLELIVVDDGSTDTTLQRVSDCARNDARVHPIAAEHRGFGASLNRGIAEARGDWIAILDADDIALPIRLEKQVMASAEAPHVVAWGAQAYTMSTQERILGVSRMGATSEQAFDKLRALGRPTWVIHSTAFMKKSVVLACGGYDTRLRSAVDADLLDRIAAYGPVLSLTEPLVMWRVHGRSLRATIFFRAAYERHFIEARNEARVRGTEPLSLEDFSWAWRRRPLHHRVATHRRDLARHSFRRAGICLSGCRYLGLVAWLMASFALRPWTTLRSIWTRRLSSESRAHIRAVREGSLRSTATRQSP